MHSTRRGFLGVLAGLPVVGCLVKAELEEEDAHAKIIREYLEDIRKRGVGQREGDITVCFFWKNGSSEITSMPPPHSTTLYRASPWGVYPPPVAPPKEFEFRRERVEISAVPNRVIWIYREV